MAQGKGSRSIFINTDDAGIDPIAAVPTPDIQSGTISGLINKTWVNGVGTQFLQTVAGTDFNGNTTFTPPELEQDGFLYISTTHDLRRIKAIYSATLLEVDIPFSATFATEDVLYIPPYLKFDTLSILVVGTGSGQIQGSDGNWSTILQGTSDNIENLAHRLGTDPIVYDASAVNCTLEIHATY